MPDASPIRWHLAHTTWFFETFILKQIPGYQPYRVEFEQLFNSYYNAIGKPFSRADRGLITRPGTVEIYEYRQAIDDLLIRELETPDFRDRFLPLVILGLNHEQQHQELMLTDLKHMLSCNPICPTYVDWAFDEVTENRSAQHASPAGIYELGADGQGFCFDNELPRHKAYAQAFSVDEQLVTCAQYLEFMQDGGYERPEFWLSQGWQAVQDQSWDAPMYWVQKDGDWKMFTLSGLVAINPEWPVTHVSYFEADAFARWSGKRLPTELEWEVSCGKQLTSEPSNNLFADELFEKELCVHPTRAGAGLLGSVWEWTSSSYEAYPGFQPAAGAVGEYNGKFMCNQYVLRGGSVATPRSHIRPTYRNFFPAETRWQFSGIRLAE